MKVCIISPISHISQYSKLGGGEMCLSHIVLGIEVDSHNQYVLEESEYRKVWRKQYINYYKDLSKSKFVILDNSAYEIGKLEASKASGEGLKAELVLQAAEIINPSIVVCQDVLCDKDGTLQSTKQFLAEVKRRGLLGKFQLMAVPQGRSKDEWLESYKELSEIPEIDMLGFSKISTPLSFIGNQSEDLCVTKGRLLCTTEISNMFDQSWKFKPVHLLGGDNGLGFELSQQSKHSWIFSNDSSCAVWYGLNNQTFDQQGNMAKIITTKPDLENHYQETWEKLNYNKQQIIHNISTLLELAK